ncbi:hypothetical protein IES07_002516 [Salmonella enterica subsp. enterica serovar Stanley]|nr:hypothetical protein [Salmonella enterica subsp. enterica serovar Stanley]
MKIYNTSLIKKGILLSLVLLSPEILAAENLNFNYTRADASGLDPRLSKLAQVCHTLDEPLEIEVRFKPDMNTQNYSYVMTVEGVPVNKGYAMLSVLSAGKAVTDPDLQVPWRVHLSGKASLDVVENSLVAVTTYDDPFCFDDHLRGAPPYEYPQSYTYKPIYRDPPYTKGLDSGDYVKYCIGFNPSKPARIEPPTFTDTFWSNYEYPPAEVHRKLKDEPFDSYMGKYLFYRGSTTTAVGKDHWETKDPDVTKIYDNPASQVQFPVSYGDKLSITKNVRFVVRADNRNITGLKLEIIKHDTSSGSSDVLSTLTWKRDSSYLNNVLAFQGFTAGSFPFSSAGEIKEDPYAKSFYIPNVKKGLFRGTLVVQDSLQQAYTDYIQNITPLSLPAKNQGDINLVNTNKLIFEMGQDAHWGGGPTITVYGQPLKFGPLYAGNQKEVLSAMQVRNACY